MKSRESSRFDEGEMASLFVMNEGKKKNLLKEKVGGLFIIPLRQSLL
jgi:hypothetical protein